MTLSFSKGAVKVITGSSFRLRYAYSRNNLYLVSGPTKLSVPGFSLDDTSTSDDVQEDTGSDPNKRSWFTIFNILYISSDVVSSTRCEEGSAFDRK